MKKKNGEIQPEPAAVRLGGAVDARRDRAHAAGFEGFEQRAMPARREFHVSIAEDDDVAGRVRRAEVARVRDADPFGAQHAHLAPPAQWMDRVVRRSVIDNVFFFKQKTAYEMEL